MALQLCRRIPALTCRRASSSSSWNRPSPPPLPRDQQREFEELQRVAQTPLASHSKPKSANASLSTAESAEVALSLHPDARKPLKPAFEGDVNPATGERGGPKQEPVHHWGGDSGGDWSFKGRVSDF